MTPDDERHGTYAGAMAHRRDGEKSCEPCRDAYAAYTREWRKSHPDDAKRTRARERALWALARLHKDEFDRLYAAEARKALGQPRLDAEVVQ